MDLSQDSVPPESVPPPVAAGVPAPMEPAAFFAPPDGLAPVEDRRRQPRISEKPDRRREARFPLTGSPRVSWVGVDHQMRHVNARGRDISEEGLGVWMSEAPPLGALVNVDLCGCGLSALCRVRHL